MSDNWEHALTNDDRPVDLNAIRDLLQNDVDNTGEIGIWGGYGPPAAPVSHVVRLILDNADAIESRSGDYSEESDDGDA